MTVTDACLGKTYEVIKVNGETVIMRRLLDMGFTPKTKITVGVKAPYGGGVSVRLRGYEVALHTEVAGLIEVAEL